MTPEEEEYRNAQWEYEQYGKTHHLDGYIFWGIVLRIAIAAVIIWAMLTVVAPIVNGKVPPRWHRHAWVPPNDMRSN